MDINHFEQLKQLGIKKSYTKGEIVFFQGDEAKHLHFLTKGIVKIYKHDAKNNEIMIDNLIAPTLVAELANFEKTPFPANCIFESSGEIYRIDYHKFESALCNNPEFSFIFIKSLTKKIKSLENFINYNITSDNNSKIAKFLHENESILKDLTQVKIATILNITPETLSRKLAKFKKEKIIENASGYINILDINKLQNIFNA